VADRPDVTASDAGATTGPPAGQAPGRRPGAVRLSLVVGAFGVVFGDIGTSPIYTLQTVFNCHPPTRWTS
jgi:KUP system potassium uptake protein